MNTYFDGIITALGSGTVITAVILLIRYRKRDNAIAKRDNAAANKTDADSVKTLAESYQIRVGADMEIMKHWQVITETLEQQRISEREEFKRQIAEERDDCLKDMDKLREHFNHKLDKMQGENNLLKEEVHGLREEIDLLKSNNQDQKTP